jgi:hypothetical protein
LTFNQDVLILFQSGLYRIVRKTRSGKQGLLRLLRNPGDEMTEEGGMMQNVNSNAPHLLQPQDVVKP